MLVEAVNHISRLDVQFWVGLLIVAGCLIAAAVVLYKTGAWVISLGLCGIALLAGVLLLA